MSISSLVEIKYVSHIFRNVYLYFLIFLASSLLYDFRPGGTRFFVGMIVLVFGYTSVYFFNDYADHAGDPKYGKRNLYLDIVSKKLFWIIATGLLTFGLLASAFVSTKALALFGVLIASNLAYSFRPFRFRDISFIRECTLFGIYFIKWLYILELIGFTLNGDIPLLLLITGSAFAGLMGAFYKRHFERDTFAEYFFWILFLCTGIVALYQYPVLWIFLIPLVPTALYFHIRYKDTQIPFGRYQFLHFLYLLAVYLYLSLWGSF